MVCYRIKTKIKNKGRMDIKFAKSLQKDVPLSIIKRRFNLELEMMRIIIGFNVPWEKATIRGE